MSDGTFAVVAVAVVAVFVVAVVVSKPRDDRPWWRRPPS
jgi:hypothetical protein